MEKKEQLLTDLCYAVGRYCDAHDNQGCMMRVTGEAWVVMRKIQREALKVLKEKK